MLGLGALTAGLCGGMLSGLFGIGGGIILIPMLGLLLGLSQHQAQGVTLAAMILPNGLPAVLHLRRQGIRIHWPLVAMLTCGFLPAVWAGARIVTRIPDGPLRSGFGIVLLLMALRTWFQGSPKDLAHEPAPSWQRMLLPGLGAGLAGGLASGLLGIGGGIIIIPLLVWSLALSQHEAQAASLAFMLAPIGLPGVLVYARHQGGLPWLVLGGIAVGFMSGAYLGARVATRARGPRLRKGFAVLMACAALLMLL
jgi:hypothetical protein